MVNCFGQPLLQTGPFHRLSELARFEFPFLIQDFFSFIPFLSLENGLRGFNEFWFSNKTQ